MFQAGTYIMRNATMKYWVTKMDDGRYKIEVRIFDYFDLKVDEKSGEKDDTYVDFAKVLDPLHQASGGNSNMQTRVTWTIYR